MYIRQLIIRQFRGFGDLTLRPKRHVVLMGEPGAGRSGVIDALSRVLDPDAIRTITTTELDFHRRNTTNPIEIEVTIGGLNSELEQNFLDNLEVWNLVTDQLVEEGETPENITGEDQEWVLRLAYRGQWLADQERCEEWVYYPKHSDPASQSFTRVRLTDIEQLGFTHLRYESGRILDLGTRGAFRRIVEKSSGSDFAAAITQYVQEVANAAGRFTASDQVKKALDDVIASMREILRVQPEDVSQLVKFSPEGGSPSGLLRSLGPAIDFGNGAGALPAWRQGSTISALFRLAESLTLSSGSQNVIAIDDLGDGMDPASATHFGARIRSTGGQAWITTRLPSVAEIFEPAEVIRLCRAPDGTRFARQGSAPTTKSEMIAAKHWHRNLLPVLSYHSVIVVEGPQDLAALHTLAICLFNAGMSPLPAAHSVAIISAGATGSGGYANVMRLTAAAREMGLRAVGVVDGDTSAEAIQFLKDHANDADAVIRLPDGAAIELAIVHGVTDTTMRKALSDVSAAANLPAIPGLDSMPEKELETQAIGYIKKNALHAAFIEALPVDNLPPLARTLLENAVLAAREQLTGAIQL